MGVLQTHIEQELAAADEMIVLCDYSSAFSHLERAYVLGQAITFDHTRIHWRMLKLGFRIRNLREIFGRTERLTGEICRDGLGDGDAEFRTGDSEGQRS